MNLSTVTPPTQSFLITGLIQRDEALDDAEPENTFNLGQIAIFIDPSLRSKFEEGQRIKFINRSTTAIL